MHWSLWIRHVQMQLRPQWMQQRPLKGGQAQHRLQWSKYLQMQLTPL
jgi:hypothetical protein